MEVEFKKEVYMQLQPTDIKFYYFNQDDDVQFHAWGSTLLEAFEQCGLAMFDSMMKLDSIIVDSCYQIEVHADDLEGLLFEFLNELLQMFTYSPNLVFQRLEITKFDTSNFSIECRCYAEHCDIINMVEQGQELQEINSAIQILQGPEPQYFEVLMTIKRKYPEF